MRRLQFVAVLGALATCACGYAPLRTTLPAGLRRVAVRPFAVAAATPELGAWIAEDVAAELAASPGVELSSGGAADAIVSGRAEVVGDEAVVLAAGPGGPRAAMAAAMLEVSASLDARDGTTLRAAGPLRLQVTRAVHPVGAGDLARETRTMRALAAEAARAVVRALFAPE